MLYNEYFTKAALKNVYEEHVSFSHAVGRDGIRQKTFKANIDDEINLILKKVGNCTYRFTRYKQKLISKGPHKMPRVISIPTIRDRLTLRALNNILMELFSEARILRPHVYIKSIGEYFKKPRNDMAFVRIDIKDFYPSINQDTLIRKVRRKVRKAQLIHLIRLATATPTTGVKPEEEGIPQGLSISNILASIYLCEIDLKFQNRYQYFRYVDDILVICKSDKAQSVFEEIQANIKAIDLNCHTLGNEGKSQIVPVTKGTEYLGFYITSSRISVRASSFTRMLENLLAVFTDYKYLDRGTRNENRLVWRLNLKITGCIYNGDRYGWVFYFSQIDDLRQLARLDHFVTEQMNKRELGHLRAKVKKFMRSYHEIRLNLRKTKYIPKYDEYEVGDIIDELSRAEGKPKEYYGENFTEQEIKDKFTKLIDRQTRFLEKDLIEAIS